MLFNVKKEGEEIFDFVRHYTLYMYTIVTVIQYVIRLMYKVHSCPILCYSATWPLQCIQFLNYLWLWDYQINQHGYIWILFLLKNPILSSKYHHLLLECSTHFQLKLRNVYVEVSPILFIGTCFQTSMHRITILAFSKVILLRILGAYRETQSEMERHCIS